MGPLSGRELLVCPYLVEGARELCELSYKSTNLVHRAPPSCPKNLHEAPPLKINAFGVRISAYESGGGWGTQTHGP